MNRLTFPAINSAPPGHSFPLGAFRPAFALFLFYLFSSTVTRAVLVFRIDMTGTAQPALSIAEAFLAGFLADLATALVLGSFIQMLLTPLRRLWRGRKGMIIGQVFIFAVVWLMVFGIFAEIFFWEEFANRFNGIAVFYLIFPREVIGNIHESFNLAIWLPVVSVAALILWMPLRRRFANSLRGLSLRGKKRMILPVCLAVLVTGVTAASMLPARISENRELNELSRNGLVSMVQAAVTNDEEYLGRYPSLPPADALRRLRANLQQDNTRYVDPTGGRHPTLRAVTNPGPEKRLNIILVLEESFGANLVDGLDNQTGVSITPNLNRLKQNGAWFTNLYASGDRTVRGLEASLTSFAPIPGISTARRPGSKGMYSIPKMLEKKGYRTAMLYGGRAMFDNMGAFWEGIGFDHIWEQADVRHEAFTTIWGVSDEDLFTEALQRMDDNAMAPESDRAPFFLSLLTVSNHRPYKFPQDNVQWKEDRGRIENTATYADWAFGNFIDRARAKPWFDDTVFIFLADHGRKVNGSAQVPIHQFRIPALFYAPKHIKPQVIDTLAAQIDVMPTLFGLLGFSYDSPFFGLDVNRMVTGRERIIAAHNFSVAYGKPGELAVLEPTNEILSYEFTPGRNPGPRIKGSDAVSAEAVSTVQSAHAIFYGKQYHDRD